MAFVPATALHPLTLLRNPAIAGTEPADAPYARTVVSIIKYHPQIIHVQFCAQHCMRRASPDANHILALQACEKNPKGVVSKAPDIARCE